MTANASLQIGFWGYYRKTDFEKINEKEKLLNAKEIELLEHFRKLTETEQNKLLKLLKSNTM